jgi:hypothetical protein
MSDAPREEEIYQALAPGGSYKSGLVNPVAAQQEDVVSIPMRFKGAMGGQAVGNEEYPDHEPRASVPYKHYKDLEDVDPKLHQAVTQVADEIHIPRTDLASLVYANSNYNPNARNGARTGYMGLTPDDARYLDPEGHLDINDPIDNLFMGAMKYKRISNRFGMGTPNSFAAYHGGGDQISAVLNHDPDEHRRVAPDGTFDFLNKVLGRDGGTLPTAADEAGGGDDGQGSDVAAMAAAAQATQQPQRHVPGQGAVPPMTPNAPPVPEVRALPPAGAPQAPSQATQDILQDREAQDRAPEPPGFYSRARISPSDPLPPLPPERQEYQPPFTPAPQRQEYQPPFTPAPALSPSASVAPEGTVNQLPPREPVLTGVGGALTPSPPPPLPERQEYQPPFTPRTSGGYAVGGAIPTATQGTTPDDYPGRPPVPGQSQPTTGSGAPAPAPRQQAIGTDSMAADLNRQELARVQGGRPDVVPTGPTQAPVQQAAPTPAAPAAVGAGAGAAAAASPIAPVAGVDDRTLATLSPGQGPVAAPQAPNDPSNYTAIGDSLAAHMIRKGGVRGKEDPAKIGSYREGDTAVSGWGTQKVLELIDKVPLGQIQGQDVVLSTGASNSPTDLAAIPKQIARLKELGAKSVSVLGVGTRADFAGVNDQLAKFVADAKDPSVVFAGALPNVGADKVHSTDPSSVFQSARRALAGAAGAAPTTGSGAPTPTTAPGAGGDTSAPAANLPAGAPRALAPPGSAPTATSAPPIDRLRGNNGAMTPAGAVRAGAEGPGPVLTYIARNGPRGASMGEAWDHFEDLLTRAMIMKGDVNGIQHAQEYVFTMKHKGAMDNLMQAIGNMDDPNAAVQYLAKSHAFVTDGTSIGFQVLNNQIYGQRYDEQTHDKIGKPFQVTEQGLRMQAIANSSREKFLSNLNTERTTTETGRHNRKQETHADEQLKQQDEASKRSLQEKQIEFDIRTQDRKEQQEREDRRARELQTERLQQQKDERERDRQNKQIIADAAARERAERDAQRQHDKEQAAADRAAEKDRTQQKVVHEDLADIGDQIDKTYPEPERANKARQMYTGIRTYNPTIDHKTGQEYMHGLMTNRYSLSEAERDPNDKSSAGAEEWVAVRDKAGNELARVPRRIWAPYLPSSTEPSSSTRPTPRAPR